MLRWSCHHSSLSVTKTEAKWDPKLAVSACRASAWPLLSKSVLRQTLNLAKYHNGFRTFKDVTRFPKSEHFVTGSVTVAQV